MNEHKIYMAMTICNSTDRGKCKLCPYNTIPRCTERMLRDAKATIVCKDAKVDELQRKNSELEIELTAMRGAANSYKSEAARLQATVDAELDTVHKLGDDYERALEEINRKNEEIERLKGFRKESFINLLGNCLVYSKNLKDYNDMRKGLKSEAYKEFAEKLKKKAYRNNYCQDIVSAEDIDRTLTELTERKEDEGK